MQHDGEPVAANVEIKQVSSYVATPCHCWKRKCNNSGYPVLNVRDADTGKVKTVYAHRVSVELHTGEIIREGYQADHRCYETTCINPEHIEVVPAKVNHARRRVGSKSVH